MPKRRQRTADGVWARATPHATGATGLEPAASGVTGQRSNQLSYAPVKGSTEIDRAGIIAVSIE